MTEERTYTIGELAQSARVDAYQEYVFEHTIVVSQHDGPAHSYTDFLVTMRELNAKFDATGQWLRNDY